MQVVNLKDFIDKKSETDHSDCSSDVMESKSSISLPPASFLQQIIYQKKCLEIESRWPVFEHAYVPNLLKQSPFKSSSLLRLKIKQEQMKT